ncbi:MAG: hypothetical protein Devi2KO_25750 [Devosia indica]
MKQLLRTIETVAHLRPSQIAARLWFKVYRPFPDRRAAPDLRVPRAAWMSGPVRRPSLLAADRARFLNIEAEIGSAAIWQDRSRGDLWRYNLHYFDDLLAEHAAERREWHLSLIARWIAENPPGTGAGWEPYTLSLRIVNWIKWHMVTGGLTPHALNSLAIQVRYLRQRLEYHILGNHLLANAKAIYFAGLFFGGNEGKGWLNLGQKILASQVHEQILADGGHFELSPMYHLIIAEDLLDCVNASSVYHQKLPDMVLSAAAKTVAWAEVMQHTDQEIPFFNDATLGISPKPREVSSYAEHLGVSRSPPPTVEEMIASSGYVRLEAGEALLFVDAAAIGPKYQPGHAHADSLSFELSFRGHRVFVNSGTSLYGVSSERQRQRGTAAHNCLVIDGENSTDVWAGFRVARRAKIVQRHLTKTDNATMLVATHDGYARLPGRPIHSRSWLLNRNYLRIEDRVDGEGRHTIDVFLRLHPALSVGRKSGELCITLPTERELRLVSALPLNIEPATWHPGFGVSVNAKMLHASMEVDLPWSGCIDIFWER